MLKKKQPDAKQMTAQSFLNIEDISEDLLYSRDGYVFAFLSVRAGDNQLLSEQERVLKAQNLTQAMTVGDMEPIQIISVPRTVDTMGMIDYLAEQRKATREDSRLKLINGEIAALQELAREGTKEPMIVIKCWVRASRGADSILKKRLRELRARLMENQIPSEIMTDQEIVYFCKVFADLTTYQSSEADVFEDVPLLAEQRRLLSKRTESDSGAALRNLLTPVGGLSFGVSRVTVGCVVGRVYGAMRYPSELDYGWAVDLVNNSDCVTAITYSPGNAGDLGDALSRSINRSATEAVAERDARRRKRYEKQALDADQLISELDFKNAAIGHVSILTMPFTSNEDKLEDLCRAVCNRYARKRIRLKPLGNLQQEAYRQLSPYHVTQPAIDDVLRQIMPLESLMGGFPMTVNIYRDDHGCYFARTMDGGFISLDLLYRGRDRTNGNIVATGAAGKGKSTALKHLVQSLYMTGVKIIIIDPEREFRDLCRNLNGTWLDVGGGTAKVNPLQIRPVPEDDEEEQDPLYRANDNAMALHIHTLEVFFKLYLPSLTDLQRALLKKELVALYNEKGIVWDTDVTQLQPEDFPLMSDLYTHLLTQKEDARYEELAALLYDIAEGADSFLWNGCTNVELSRDFIVLDTNRLMNSSDEVKRAQYFNNLTMCWEIMSRDRQQPVFLLCDEAHILLDPAIPQTAMFLRNMAKRSRKYEAMLAVVTQSVVDLLHEQIKLYGQAILDNAAYKLLFGADGKNLEETAALFQLTEMEKNILLGQERGQALCLLGKQHIHVDFDIPSYKLELMGKGGGR